jgi:hypothetical protein
VGATPPQQGDIHLGILILVAIITQFFDEIAQAVQGQFGNSIALFRRTIGEDPSRDLKRPV